MEVLLDVEGVVADSQAPDGTTAFDMALGHGDGRMLSVLLQSPCVEPKTHMLDLLARVKGAGNHGNIR